MSVDLSQLSDEELFELRSQLEAQESHENRPDGFSHDPSKIPVKAPSKKEKELRLTAEPNSLKRAIGRRAIPAVKSALTLGLAPHLLDSTEEKIFGKEYRPRNESEEDDARFWEGAGGYSTGLLGGAGVVGALGKGLVKAGTKKFGTKVLKAASSMVKAAPSVPGMAATGLTAEHIEPQTKKLHPVLGIPAHILGATALHSGVGSLSKLGSVPAKMVGLKPENVEAFRNAGVPYTLGDVAPAQAKRQTASQLISPSKKLENIYAKRAKVLEDMTPTKFDVEDAAERIVPAADKYAAAKRAEQARLADEISEMTQKAGIDSFKPYKTQAVLNDYRVSLEKQGAKGAAPYKLPKKLKDISRQVWADNIPMSEATMAGDGLLDKLSKILPEQHGASFTREQGLAAKLRRAIADDMLNEIERRAPAASATEKARRAQWKEWMVEQKQHKSMIQPETNPNRRMASLLNDFESGGKTFNRILPNVPEHEQKDFFNKMVRGLSTYRDQHSIVYLAKRFNNLTDKNKEFLLENMAKFNGVDKTKIKDLFESQRLSGLTEKTLNTSRTAPTSLVYEEQKALADAGADLFAGNADKALKGIKKWAKYPLTSLSSEFKNERFYGSKKLIDAMYALNNLHNPSQVPSVLKLLKKAGDQVGVNMNTDKLNRIWVAMRTPAESLTAKRATKVHRALKSMARNDEE